MKRVAVIQHTESEYLGLIEDHLEGRNIRFQYFRPFAASGTVPGQVGSFDGLILLGGGPYGVVSGHLLPSLAAELRLARAFLEAGLPVLGFGLGALVLTVAAGGGAREAPLRFVLDEAQPAPGQLPGVESFPLACYLRDAPALPPDATVLAGNQAGQPLVFALRDNAIGFLGHPGIKRGMAEDLIMEFEETPPETLLAFEQLAASQRRIAEQLSPLMVAIIARCGWM